ncbi:MAG TPA: hypothetical protein PK661_02775 [Syntrophorhabdaceae bacterium]|jgi:hypothetical protein|nr:hypothetical protein [Pseudomonadota bacterium]HOS58996.1 hypothetical protein [Syntrophorhabdaceae bacterium]
MATTKQAAKNVAFRFYLNDVKDTELIEKLQNMPSYMRNDFVRDALRQFVSNYQKHCTEKAGLTDENKNIATSFKQGNGNTKSPAPKSKTIHNKKGGTGDEVPKNNGKIVSARGKRRGSNRQARHSADLHEKRPN